MNVPVRIFCVYSHEDAELAVQFKHAFKQQGIVHQWYDRVISSETEFQGYIDENLEQSDLIILVVSASFLLSGYCSGREMTSALVRHDSGDALVIPLILRPSIWQAILLRDLKVFPTEGKPVTTWESLDQAWDDVIAGIREVIDAPLLGAFYRDLCARGRNALLKRAVDIAPFLDDLAQDKRLGLTLIVRPSAEVAGQLTAINNLLRQSAPQHFYYDQPRLHFTILSIINASDPPKVSRDLAMDYEKPIREVMEVFPTFEVKFSGICATPSSIIARGFPLDDKLERLRDAIRERLHSIGLGSGLDERYQIHGAHITLGRFRILEDFLPLVNILDQMSNIPLGSMHVQYAQLVLNDFYMSPGKVQPIAEFTLGNNISNTFASLAHDVASDSGNEYQRATEVMDKPIGQQEGQTIEDQSYDVFISYSHADKQWVHDWLLPRLEKDGLKVCIDFRDFIIGVPSLVNMERAVKLSEKTLLVITPNWVKSEWTNFEALMTQTLDPIGLKQRVLPLMLEKTELPLRLKIFTYADFTSKENWEDRIAHLISQIGKRRWPPATRVLHNLPAKQAIVGRQDEHDYIINALSEADKGIILTSGYGGIGKSMLAEIVGWTCVEQGRPFNLVVLVDARRYNEAISLDSVLNKIAEVAGNSDILAITEPNTKQAQVRELLKSHRSLIILDNHEDLLHHNPNEEKKLCAFLDSLPIGPMIVGADTYIRVLITTREVSAGLEDLPIENLKLEKLPLEDSIEFMKSRIPAHIKLTIKQYERIWTTFCGLPKYMKIVSDQLKTLTFADWEKDVANIDEMRLDEGEKIFESDRVFNDLFGLSWKRFSEDFKKILLSMAFFVGEASPEALRRASGLSRAIFTDVLASASDAYIESTGSGYRVHPLTHTFCRTMLRSRNFEECYKKLGQRFTGYFLDLANQLGEEQKFDQLEQEIRNIVAAARLAEELELWEPLITFRKSTAVFFRLRGYWNEQIETTLHAVNACRELGKRRELAEHLVHDLGWLFLRLEDLCNAEKHINIGLDLFRELGIPDGIAQGLRHLGKSALLKGLDCKYRPNELWNENAVVAEKNYQESLDLREAIAENGIDQRRQIADMKLDFGRLYWLWGIGHKRDGRQKNDRALIGLALEKYEKANAVSIEAKDIFAEISDNRGIAKAWGNMGNATKEIVRLVLREDQLIEARQRIIKAHEYYENNLAIAARIGRRDEIAHALWGLTEVYELYADYPDLHNMLASKMILIEKALNYAEESHSLYTFLGGPKDIKATGELVDRIREKLSQLQL